MKLEKQHRTLESYSQSFSEFVSNHVNHDGCLSALSLATFQINVGKRCNQTCVHCHVDAGPNRTEMMNRATAQRCLEIIEQIPEIESVDITGGAPEINPNFRYLVTESRKLGKRVIDRCNLTILEYEDFEYLYEFLAENEVEIVASLPHFARRNTDRQRGEGAYDTSITALKKLNRLGYGTKLPLNLVYNPVGLFLSAPQKELEREFKQELQRRHGIAFNSLYCINNLPINRFLAFLVRNERFEDYMETLVTAFNPGTLDGLMCRHQISVGYDGKIYDCDFNQMLEMEAQPIDHIDNFDYDAFMKRRVVIGNHCFGCTAGAGSSCGGEIIEV